MATVYSSEDNGRRVAVSQQLADVGNQHERRRTWDGSASAELLSLGSTLAINGTGAEFWTGLTN